MNLREGYRRLSVVIGTIAGPVWFLYQLLFDRSSWRSADLLVVLVLASVISFATWLFLWATAKALIWVLEGLRSAPQATDDLPSGPTSANLDRSPRQTP
ncbi:MAG: hypothetical protein E5V67_09280 [Mesorhizobium sp.]|uniref:hypothetical protein n=1 Tax=unclassified Mesorhizobium TaxID=325217 RepID=UPI000FDA1D10|nr:MULTISPECIES: hypothetical protein [unclassified Mesorhizobium]TGQ20037.1 hypothetical protein EN860_014910 [Mesorhizobium sp. M00.F.Ca.ET.217.01.1.1]TGS69166.1 hypothetical protein EN844_09875 [Mesorhizobium sp. M3A.F.Ca.ET.201.01.1.1]TGV94510.1 hypothetical protein EN801_002450 [Mesorhizobium sp. M00.F.Ca.ET.158.01.1.1]TKB40050.1 MAG: hypothetical protein E5V67_09280 [Mesorhizobium sp.]